MSLSIINKNCLSQFWGSKLSLFDNLAKKGARPQNTAKTRVSATSFWKTYNRHEMAICGQTPKTRNSIFFFCFFFCLNHKSTNLLKPLLLQCCCKHKNSRTKLRTENFAKKTIVASKYNAIYIYAVELITWPFFGHFRVNNLAMVELITWPFFEPIKIGFFGDFLVHSYQGVVQNQCF